MPFIKLFIFQNEGLKSLNIAQNFVISSTILNSLHFDQSEYLHKLYNKLHKIRYELFIKLQTGE